MFAKQIRGNSTYQCLKQHTGKNKTNKHKKQALYSLSTTSSPFWSGYFGDGGSQKQFAWAGLGL
jgi:uncharacterized protein (DUF2147 family)